MDKEFIKSSVVSNDGTIVGYQTVGQGPGVIIIHGALCSSENLKKLALELSDSFTVHVLDRRGRGLSGCQGSEYSIIKECEDVKSIYDITKAKYIFGHSYGGLVTLETEINNVLFNKIVLYEPGVSINRSDSKYWKWLIEYEDAMNKNDLLGAFTYFVKGSGHTILSKMPDWYARFILWLMVRGNNWENTKKLLPQNLKEHKEIQKLDSTYSKYQKINCKVLLISGKNSPIFIHEMLELLNKTISNSKNVTLEKLDHLAPENNYKIVAYYVKQYFL